MAWREGYGPSEVRELWGLTQNAYNTIPSFVEFVSHGEIWPLRPIRVLFRRAVALS